MLSDVGFIGSGLARWAPDGCSLGDRFGAELGFAKSTEFPSSAVDLVVVLEAAGFAGGVGVGAVAERAASQSDGCREGTGNGVGEAGPLGGLEVAAAGVWRDARAEEGFIGVDVAHAGDDALVEQGGFDGAVGILQAGLELIGGDGEGVGA